MLDECGLSTEDMDWGNFQCARQCGGWPDAVPCSLSQVCIDACCIEVSGEAVRCWIESYDMAVDGASGVCEREKGTVQNLV